VEVYNNSELLLQAENVTDISSFHTKEFSVGAGMTY
jgi:hypothetical protein